MIWRVVTDRGYAPAQDSTFGVVVRRLANVFASHGVLVQLQTPANDKVIADVANAVATVASE